MTIRKTSILLLTLFGPPSLNAQITVGTPIFSSSAPSAMLTNVSCRAYVGTNANVAVAGFVVSGQPGSQIQVLIRGIGPTLSKFSVSGVLAQPVLTLFDSSNKVIATNTGWGTSPAPWLISASAASIGAFALPQSSADSALLASLTPGNYTAVVSGFNNTSGIALVEVYGIPPPPPPPVLPAPSLSGGSGTG
jgi:hypothetical protein